MKLNSIKKRIDHNNPPIGATYKMRKQYSDESLCMNAKRMAYKICGGVEDRVRAVRNET